jgi:hypothetical protein
MARLSLLVLGLVLAACAIPGATLDNRPGVAGTYVVNGVDPVGIEYSGTVVIEATEDPGRYTVVWVITGAILEGDGVVDGDTFTVEWRTIRGPRGDSSGTAVYVIETDGRLTGTRTIDGVDGSGTEEIFPES